jgi:hypothetical protein
MKKQAVLYKSYTRNQPLLINGKDIITILDREETRKVSNIIQLKKKKKKKKKRVIHSYLHHR